MPLALRALLYLGANRDRLPRLLLLALALVLAGPLCTLVAVTAMAGPIVAVGPSAPVAGAVAPMDRWVVSQPYGCTGYYVEPAFGTCAHFHMGIDLVAPFGTPVRAVLAGVVEIGRAVGPCGGYGTHVVLDHKPGLVTLYGHLTRVAVTAGAAVAAGDVIGYEGSTGCSSGPHLHFEVRRDGAAVDPREAFPGLLASSRGMAMVDARGCACGAGPQQEGQTWSTRFSSSVA